MDGLKVCSGQCDQCLFSPNKIVSTNRKRDIINTCLAEDTYFVCHKATIAGEEVVCRGWYDTYGSCTNLIRIAQRLHAVQEVDVETLGVKS
jgi:hypothetical protein